MILSYLRVEGFRGIKNRLDIEFPPGFAIICGRNGSGKSTICDAIEFGISGSIKQGILHTERGETIKNYIWWCGKNRAEYNYVEVGIEDETGNIHKFIQSKGDRYFNNEQKLRELLCHPEYSVSDALLQLCRTAIIRDEEIPQLSLELKETDRFDFARNAIGIGSFGEFEQRANDLYKYIKAKTANIERNYDQVRSRISELTIRISEIKADALGLEDLQKAEINIRLILEISDEIRNTNLIEMATRRLAELNIRINSLIRINKIIDEISSRQKEIKSTGFNVKYSNLKNRAEKIQKELESNKSELRKIESLIDESQETEPQTISLAQLYEHGKHVGLRNGRCPLCNSEISNKGYEENLGKLNEEINRLSKESLALVTRRTNIDSEIKRGIFELDKIDREISYLAQSERVLNEEKRNLLLDAEKYNIAVQKDDELTDDNVKSEIDATKNRILLLDKSITLIRVSKLYEKLPDLESQLALAKKESDQLSKTIHKYNEKSNEIKEDLDTTKRVAGEIVDERLSGLLPLLSELYYRLRPHKDWQELNYFLRGDIRRMLSLEVGEGLNPNFLFSSGQRRAVGLAFLISIHLSRPWCKLDTLLLDDPVQHIDDYRALHFTEVVSSIRMIGRQIICTVEDPALARLMVRRLRSRLGGEGKLINLLYCSGEGIKIESQEIVPPFAKGILLD